MNWLRVFICPRDEEVLEAIDLLKEGEEVMDPEDEEDVEVTENLKKWINKHGWEEVEHDGQTMWDKKKR